MTLLPSVAAPADTVPRVECPPRDRHPAGRIGKYLLRGTIGQGAMGVVHEAFDPVIGRVVALKCLRADAVEPAVAALLRRRFLLEARAAGRLSHPHLVAVHDYGEDGGRPFIVMERVRGRPLSARLAPGRRFTLAEAAQWAVPLLEALGAAHRRGIVHRDVKPDNVFLDDEGGVKLGDFGIASVPAGAASADEERVDDEETSSPPPASGVGTPHYAAPEQLRGDPAAPTADLWAVGVMLYQALTGERPFAGSMVSVLRQVAHEDPEAPSARGASVPEAADRLVRRALRKAPAERFPDAAAFRDALRAAVAQTSDAGAEAVAVEGTSRDPTGRAAIARGPLPECGLSSRRREAATRLHASAALVDEARVVLDAAQCLFADGTLLVEGDAMASRCRSLATRLDEAAEALAARRRDADALSPATLVMLGASIESAREAAEAQRAMAARIAQEATAALATSTRALDRLDERLALLEAYGQRDACAVDELRHAPARPAGRDGPAEALRRRLGALTLAQGRCRDTLQRLEAGPRLPPALRARMAAAGLRVVAVRAATAQARAQVDRWLRQQARETLSRRSGLGPPVRSRDGPG
jgi:serine/threonine-protein kinase